MILPHENYEMELRSWLRRRAENPQSEEYEPKFPEREQLMRWFSFRQRIVDDFKRKMLQTS